MFPSQPPSPQPQPLEQEPPPQAPNITSFPKILIFVLLSIFIMASITAGAYFLGKNQSNKQISTVQSSPTPTPDLNREPTGSAATANWKTYRGNGYSFKYPNDWTSTETTENRFIEAQNKTIKIQHVIIKSADITLYFDTEENNNFAKNEDYLAFIKERQRDVTFKTSKVDGTNAVYGSYFAGGVYPSEAIWHTSLDFYNNGKTYSFLIDYQKGQPQESLLLNILSTFKFTQ